jgi:hypothetical protein
MAVRKKLPTKFNIGLPAAAFVGGAASSAAQIVLEKQVKKIPLVAQSKAVEFITPLSLFAVGLGVAFFGRGNQYAESFSAGWTGGAGYDIAYQAYLMYQSNQSGNKVRTELDSAKLAAINGALNCARETPIKPMFSNIQRAEKKQTNSFFNPSNLAMSMAMAE